MLQQNRCQKRVALRDNSCSGLIFTNDSIIFTQATTQDCQSIKDILRCYGKASGQIVNMKKSCITFRPNIGSKERGAILNTLGLSNVNPHDKYLGLPTMVGRNKRLVFNNINDRVWKQINR